MPVYKVEKYLNKCIESLVNQTYKDLEIILVDDGSPDNCPQICDDWEKKDKRIKVLHQKNSGVSVARNNGLKFAGGEYIGFVDSDDYIESEMYECLLADIKQSESDISVCSHFVEKKDGAIVADSFEKSGVYSQREAVEIISYNMNNSVWNKLFKKQIVENIFFDSEHTFGEDHLFLMMVLYNCQKVSFINRHLYYYVQRENSTTGAAFSKKAFDQIFIKDAMFSLAKEKFPYVAKHYEKLCFTARENLCRKILLSDNETVFCEQLCHYISYLKKEYKNIKNRLSFAEKFEYRLLNGNLKTYKYIFDKILKLKGN